MASNSLTTSNTSNIANNSRCHSRYLPSPNTQQASSLMAKYHHHSRPALVNHNSNLAKVHCNSRCSSRLQVHSCSSNPTLSKPTLVFQLSYQLHRQKKLGAGVREPSMARLMVYGKLTPILPPRPLPRLLRPNLSRRSRLRDGLVSRHHQSRQTSHRSFSNLLGRRLSSSNFCSSIL